MSTIDIRGSIPINRVVFADEDESFNKAQHLENLTTKGFIQLFDEDRYMIIAKEDIPNLIKALQKAQEIWKD